ncbi:hypothetical protein GCM10023093_26070 [Nemorincola caseinilytica]|uniref:Uncharacterized protein n=2 Tax=Nemorincola caseinilytica TaxID=2054315 RepID=A0ABP8NJQ2_9BACT
MFLVLGLIIGIGGTMMFGNRKAAQPVIVTGMQTPADMKNTSVLVEAKFQERLDSLSQTNDNLTRKVSSSKTELQKAKQDNKVLLELVDTLLAHSAQTTDTATRLAQCDSLGATVQELIVTTNLKDSLYEDMTSALQAQVSNKDSVISTQQERYNVLRLSFDQSLAQQDLLASQSLLLEKRLKRMKANNRLLSVGLFVLTGIGTATIVALHH